MDLFRMQCFVSVAKNLSLTKAAREMFITQPSMSAQMSSLESELGVVLFLRTRKGLVLTPAGAVAAERFQQLLEQYKEIETDLRSIQSRDYARIRIGYHGPSEWARLADLLRAFREHYPYVEIELVIDMWDSLRERLLNRDVDVAFIEASELEKEQELESCVVLRDRIMVVTPPDHPFAAMSELTPEQLQDEHIILPDYNMAPSFFHRVVLAFRKFGLHGSEVSRGNYSEALNTLVAAGYGISMMPASFCQSSSTVAVVPLKSNMYVNIALAWHREEKSRAVALFTSFASQFPWEDRA